MATEEMRRGDLVEVKGPAEILTTLDEQGALEALPFMPEMAAYCGRRYAVERRAERVCDTVAYSGSRRPARTVLLADLRCDGSAHGGCQAECRYLWKEAWLRRVSDESPPAPAPSAADVQALLQRTTRGAQVKVDVDGRAEERFRCQATELPRASEHLHYLDPRSYVRELTTGNVTPGHWVRVMSRVVVREPMRKLGLIPEVHLAGTRMAAADDPPLNLQPGELVRVKTKEEIAKTLTPKGRHRGLWFDREMMPYCGRTFRVRRRIHRFVDDRDGKLVELKNECVTLEGVVCSGDHSLLRWFCPRELFPYWRECWLERVEPPAAGAARGP